MVFPELNRAERGHDFYPTSDEIASIPALYEAEDMPLAQKIVHAHFFTRGGAGDWYVFELDREDDTRLRAFGWARITDGEFGYFDLIDLESLLIRHDDRPSILIERDLCWTPKPWSEVER